MLKSWGADCSFLVLFVFLHLVFFVVLFFTTVDTRWRNTKNTRNESL